MKVVLLLAYDGSGFRGFARQPRVRTVQGELEDALSRVLRSPIRTTGAGRTDAGVHAAAQVVSLEAPDGTDPEWLLSRLNRFLSADVSVRAAAAAPDRFDARFSARARTYEYRIYRDPTRDPLLDRFWLHVPEPLRLGAIRAGAGALVGEHDFASFCRTEGKPSIRRVRALTVSTPAPARVILKITADSFCQQMVRSIVGLLLQVGRGRRPPEDVPRVLATRRRDVAGQVAPAWGLHLTKVRYAPDPFQGAGISEEAGAGRTR